MKPSRPAPGPARPPGGPAGRLSRRLAAAVLITACVSPRDARADDLALDRFQPAPAGDRFLGVPSPYVAGDLDAHALLLVEYAHRPLLLRRVADHVEAGALVAGQAVFHAGVSLALRRRLLLHVDIPFVALQASEVEGGPGLADFGDVRLGLRVRLLGEDAGPFQLGLGGDFWAPTGTGAFVTDGAVRGRPYVAGGGILGPVVWSAMLGAELRPSQLYLGSVTEGTSLGAGVGAGLLLGEERRLQLGLEISASVVAEQPDARTTHAELLFQGRYRILDRLEIGAGVGPGLSSGVGTPQLRAALLLAYVPVADLRPFTPSRTSWPSTARFETVGPPAEPAPPPPPPPAEDAADVRLSGDEIVTGGEIAFAFGSAELADGSEAVIHAVADFLIAHPEIGEVEVRGHADIDGTLEVNERLARRRAEAVRQALIHHSIEPARLVARGFGPRAPAAASATAEGRRRNRRVELWVSRRAEP